MYSSFVQIAIATLVPTSLAATLYNGAQTTVLSPSMSQSCKDAFDTSIDCPANDIQLVTYGTDAVGMLSTVDELPIIWALKALDMKLTWRIRMGNFTASSHVHHQLRLVSSAARFCCCIRMRNRKLRLQQREHDLHRSD